MLFDKFVLDLTASMFGATLSRPNEKYVERCIGEQDEAEFNNDLQKCTMEIECSEMRTHCKNLEQGYVRQHHLVQVGKGRKKYIKLKKVLEEWKHFNLPWAFIAYPKKVQTGQAVAVVSKVFGVWTVNPLKVTYKVDGKWTYNEDSGERFAFAHNTLEGHLIKGEERFAAVHRETDDTVWYSIYTVSKPAHWVSRLGLPLMRHMQKSFQKQSAWMVMKQVSNK